MYDKRMPENTGREQMRRIRGVRARGLGRVAWPCDVAARPFLPYLWLLQYGFDRAVRLSVSLHVVKPEERF